MYEFVSKTRESGKCNSFFKSLILLNLLNLFEVVMSQTKVIID